MDRLFFFFRYENKQKILSAIFLDSMLYLYSMRKIIRRNVAKRLDNIIYLLFVLGKNRTIIVYSVNQYAPKQMIGKSRYMLRQPIGFIRQAAFPVNLIKL